MSLVTAVLVIPGDALPPNQLEESQVPENNSLYSAVGWSMELNRFIDELCSHLTTQVSMT